MSKCETFASYLSLDHVGGRLCWKRVLSTVLAGLRAPQDAESFSTAHPMETEVPISASCGVSAHNCAAAGALDGHGCYQADVRQRMPLEFAQCTA